MEVQVMQYANPIYFHIGLPKTGTTTIQHVIKKDSRINVISSRYFHQYKYWEETFELIKADKLNVITEENQVLQMPDAGKLLLLLARIKQAAPQANIIVTVREQRALLESRYKYQFDWHGGYTKSFNTWLRSGQGLDYLSICMYNTLYTTINAFFPAQQIHFLLFEDLKADFTGFFMNFYKILSVEPPQDLVNTSLIKNKSMPEAQLLRIRQLNRFKVFTNDTTLAKYEFALFRKLAGLVSSNSKNQEAFRWHTIETSKKIEADFARENTALVEKGVFAKEKLELNGYLI